MKYLLGLGSNVGNRKQNLESAVKELHAVGSRLRVSPVYETPALLPRDADPSWNHPYLNLAVELESDLSPHALLARTRSIESRLGRVEGPRWAPREIDIDLLLAEDIEVRTQDLRIPHPSLKDRSFVLDPLKDLDSQFLDLARAHAAHSPVWMAILNLTPDSFSDGGKLSDESALHERLRSLEDYPIGILDIGGESTRPGHTPVSPTEEWARIERAFDIIRDFYRGREIRPLLSVDTRHFEVGQLAIERGATLINDVSGLEDSRFVDLIRTSDCSYVLTHPLGFKDLAEVLSWFRLKLDLLQSCGIRREQIIIDPGIGFGKTSLQSLTLLRNLSIFHALPHRILVGHSRKSFLKAFSERDRELESIGVSLNLIRQKADILRVHDPISHIRAFRGWSHTL